MFFLRILGNIRYCTVLLYIHTKLIRRKYSSFEWLEIAETNLLKYDIN